jgi:hypothetical protein
MIDELVWLTVRFIPLIALRMATSVPEIDDPRRTQICLCGSKETTYLSSLLAKHYRPWSQVETKTNARIAMKPDDLIYHHYVNRLVLKLRKIEYQFASVSSKQRRKRGRHLPNLCKCNTIAVRIEVAIHSTEERFSCLRWQSTGRL